jgi:hypothetical protein
VLLLSRTQTSARLLRLCAAVLSCAQALVVTGSAERPDKPKRPEVPPEVLRTPFGITEVGVIEGTQYRIDVPDDWNRSLVVFYHGYAEHGVTFHVAEKLGGQQMPFLERHYAVLQSAYSEPGWALPQAFPETETLRHYFDHAYGHPVESYVAGASMGGALTMITLELNPKPYLGGLDLCGAVPPTFESFNRRFAQRAAFDYYFPNLMGPLVPVSALYDNTSAVREKIAAALRANPEAATAMRSLMGLHTDAGVASDIAYFTFVIADMQKRSGGNPFDNRNFIYTGSTPGSSAGDFALNDGVHRYAADARARAYLYSHYTPSGHLTKPMLAVHTVYDPIIPASTLALYDHLVQGAGFGDNFVQQYVHREGHCNISSDEIGRAFDELIHWTHKGPRPAPGLLKEDAAPALPPPNGSKGKDTRPPR